MYYLQFNTLLLGTESELNVKMYSFKRRTYNFNPKWKKLPHIIRAMFQLDVQKTRELKAESCALSAFRRAHFTSFW